MQVIIYFDLEGTSGSISSIHNNTGWEKRDYENTQTLLELLDEYNVKVCFAIVGKVAEENPQFVKNIVEKGHEIACHGMYHCTFETSGQIKHAKELLETVSGQKVTTYVPPFNVPYNLCGFGVGFINVNGKKQHVDCGTIGAWHKSIKSLGFSVLRQHDIMFKQKTHVSRACNVIVNTISNSAGFNKKLKGKVVTLYGHPHSLTHINGQMFPDLKLLLKELRRKNIKTTLPREL